MLVSDCINNWSLKFGSRKWQAQLSGQNRFFFTLSWRQRSAKNSKILRKDVNKASVYVSPTGNNGVSGKFVTLSIHPEICTSLFHELIVFGKSTFIQENGDSFPGCQFPLEIKKKLKNFK